MAEDITSQTIDTTPESPEKETIAHEESESTDQDVSMSERLSELYCADGNVDTDDGLIWKTVLRTGTWRYRPGPGQRPIPTPLHVIAGNSTNPKSVIGLADIVKSFNDNAIEHVTVPLSHADKVDENTGFVRQLRVEADPEREGESVLRAGLEFTEEDIKRKVVNGSIANTSVGLFYDYIRKDDGEQFDTAMKHVALTNSPWINGMRPFGMSEETDIEVESLEFEVPEVTEPIEPTQESTPEKPAEETKQELSEEETPSQETTREVTMSKFDELKGLTLSEEEQERIESILQAREDELTALRQEKTELSEEKRERDIDARIDELKELGLSEQSGFLKVVRQVLKADTGENSLTLSEDGNDVSVTVTDAVNRLIDALPKKDGKINFGEQVESLGTGGEGPNRDTDASRENMTRDQRYEETRKWLAGE